MRCIGVEKRDVREKSLVGLLDNVCRTFVLFASNLAFMKRDFISVLKPFFVIASDGDLLQTLLAHILASGLHLPDDLAQYISLENLGICALPL